MAPVKQDPDVLAHPDLLRRPATASVLPWILTALAGALDAGCAVGLGDIHIAFVSGDTVEAGKAIVNGHVSLAVALLAVIAAFVLGAAIGAALSARMTPSGPSVALSLIGLASLGSMLGLQISSSVWGVLPLAAALGAVDAQQKLTGGAVGLSFVSGALVDFGARLAQPSSWTLREDGSRLALWLLFFVGSIAGVLASRALGLSLFLVAVASLSLALAVLFGVRILPRFSMPPSREGSL